METAVHSLLQREDYQDDAKTKQDSHYSVQSQRFEVYPQGKDGIDP